MQLWLYTLRKMGGFLKRPTPGGVPVRTTSPGLSVKNLRGKQTQQCFIFMCREQLQYAKTLWWLQKHEHLYQWSTLCIDHRRPTKCPHYWRCMTCCGKRCQCAAGKTKYLCEAICERSTSGLSVKVDVLWDPGDQRGRPEDHLIGVAALDFLSIDQAAEGQVVRIYRSGSHVWDQHIFILQNHSHSSLILFHPRPPVQQRHH